MEFMPENRAFLASYDLYGINYFARYFQPEHFFTAGKADELPVFTHI